MDKPASQGEPATPTSDSDLLWRALMSEFEDASQEVVAKLHAHEDSGTQRALDELVGAQLRRSRALSDMLQFLDDFENTGKRR